MAEIEHYVDPLDKSHVRFGEVKDVPLTLLSKDVQQEGKTDLKYMTVGEAVSRVNFIPLNIEFTAKRIENCRQRNSRLFPCPYPALLDQDRDRCQTPAMQTTYGQ